MFLRKYLSLSMVFILIIGILSGCSDLKSTSVEDVPKVLRVVYPADIPSLDQHIASDDLSFEVIGNIIEGLFILTGDNKLENGVCESYDISEDKTTYIFKLRKDSTWSNGDPVTASDFVYSWRKLVDPKNGSTNSHMIKKSLIKNSKKF